MYRSRRPQSARRLTNPLANLADAAVVAMLLAACGGGGGDPPPSSTTTAAPTDPWATAQAQVANFGGAATVVSPYVPATTPPGTLAPPPPGPVTLAPDALCSAQATICLPAGIVLDSTGNVYVAAGNAIYKFTPTGTKSLFAGSTSAGYADGPAVAALFNTPEGITFDASGNLLVADGGNNLIRQIAPDGSVTTVAGSTAAGDADGTGSAASFNAPLDVAVDASGDIFVADGDNKAIRKISSSGAVTTLAGSPSAATFSWPTGIAVDSAGNVIVMDNGANKVLKITQAGVVTTVAGTGSTGSTNGAGSQATFGSTGPHDPLHAVIQYGPAGIVVDKFGYIFVVDRGNNEIRMITPSGVVSTLVGQPGQTWGSSNGIGSAALFDTPAHIAMDSNANLYVTEDGNSDVRLLAPVSSH